jgi:hypothetical protein
MYRMQNILMHLSPQNPEYSLLCRDLKYRSLTVHGKTNQLLLQQKGKIQTYIIDKITTEQKRLQAWLQSLQYGQYWEKCSSQPPNVFHCQVPLKKKGSGNFLVASHIINLYCTGIGDLNTILQGCQLDFNSVVNSLAVSYCNAQSAGPHVSHDTQLIKVDRNLFSRRQNYNSEMFFICEA